VADAVLLAKLVDSDWLFRDLWDFVADLVLGGDCDDDPPTSTWFWRLFYGASRLSRAVREAADPNSMALPHVESRIYFADWTSTQLNLLEGTELLTLSQPRESFERFLFVKAQVLLMGQQASIVDRALSGREGDLLRAVFGRSVGGILSALNSYVAYNLRDGAETKLELWTDHHVERSARRRNATNGLIRLGIAEAGEFEVANSQVLINHPDQSAQIRGSRQFLVHRDSQASFALNEERIRLIQEGRSLRLADRAHADLDWDVARFYESIVNLRADTANLVIAFLDFERMKHTLAAYRCNLATMVIEEGE
jgi:hypothetical protein